MDKIELFVAVPFDQLVERYLPRILGARVNPEIGLNPKVLDLFELRDAKVYFDALIDRGLCYTIHFPFVDLNPGSPDPLIRGAVMKRYELTLKWVDAFKPKGVVVHTGYEPNSHGEIRGEWLCHAKENLLWLAKELRSMDIPMRIENVFEPCPEDILELMEVLVHEGVGICLDTGHLTAFSQRPLAIWVKALKNHIEQLHIHDNRGHRDDHLGIGHGKIDFEGMFYELSQGGSKLAAITIEPHVDSMVLETISALKELWPWDPHTFPYKGDTRSFPPR